MLQKSKLSYIIYNICKQRYMRDISSVPEWFVNLANMLNRFDINFIPNPEAIIKEIVNEMHIKLKNEYINEWRGLVNRQPKCSVL